MRLHFLEAEVGGDLRSELRARQRDCPVHRLRKGNSSQQWSRVKAGGGAGRTTGGCPHLCRAEGYEQSCSARGNPREGEAGPGACELVEFLSSLVWQISSGILKDFGFQKHYY